ncbi:MAG TPA: thioesterase [Pelotomaculum sp.]|nr:thioesterase [Pelotomaculum sp.]
MSKLLKDKNHMCFACSPKNPIGLKLVFEHEGDICRASFVAGPEHQGWNGVMHGGLLTTILDEVMAQWLWIRERSAMTAEMTTRFVNPVPLGVKLTIESRLVADKRRLFLMEATAMLPDGSVAAKATAKFVPAKI